VRALREKRTVTGPRGPWDLFVTEAERGSSAVHIQAVNLWYPGEDRLLWTTTLTCLESTLDEIEDGLAEGRVVQPAGAVYSGARDRDPRPLQGFVHPDVPVAALEPIRGAAIDAYEVVEVEPRGPSRRAAWNAYALQLYGDSLLDNPDFPGFVAQDTVEMAARLFALAGLWLERAYKLRADAAPGRAPEKTLPDWITAMRSQAQLAGMRETLEAMRTFIAYDLAHHPDDGFAERLAEVDERLEEAAMLWIERQPAELRRGIGYALSMGIDEAYALGQDVARAVDPAPTDPR
jgi:hypothetical protein